MRVHFNQWLQWFQSFFTGYANSRFYENAAIERHKNATKKSQCPTGDLPREFGEWHLADVMEVEVLGVSDEGGEDLGLAIAGAVVCITVAGVAPVGGMRGVLKHLIVQHV